MGITYKGYCYGGRLNETLWESLDKYVCGDSWQQTQLNKVMLVAFVIICLIFIVIAGYKLLRR